MDAPDAKREGRCEIDLMFGFIYSINRKEDVESARFGMDSLPRVGAWGIPSVFAQDTALRISARAMPRLRRLGSTAT